MKKEEFFAEAIPNSTGPLQGVKVLEVTTSLAGPIVGTLLADLGAEVIKCELPQVGEVIRYCPPFLDTEAFMERSTVYLSVNRNKKNITLAYNKNEGATLFKELAAKVDVIIENYKPGTTDKWGIGYRDIRKIKLDIIYTSITGYGQFGPYHTKPGYDPIAQAMSGLMHITGESDGPPTTTGNFMADNLTGWQGAFATAAALFYREKTGKGQHIDVCLLDSLLYTTEMGIMAASHLNFFWERMGSGAHPIGTRVLFHCKDGYVCLLVALQTHWERLCKLISREDLITDPRTRTLIDRVNNFQFCADSIQEWTMGKTVEEVVRLFDGAELVVAKIFDFHQIIEDSHIKERNMVTDVTHPIHGKLKLYGVAAKYSLTPGKVRMHAPMLGEHNREVYQGILGYGEDKLLSLKEKGVI